MKKQFLLFIAATFFSVSLLMAQTQAPPQKMNREDRTRSTMLKFAPFDLTKANSEKVENIFNQFYISQETLMQELHSPNANRDELMQKRKSLVEERNTQLKSVLTKEQYAKFESEIDPSLRPQRMQSAPQAPVMDKNAAPSSDKKLSPAN